jgi:hypothetical protein
VASVRIWHGIRHTEAQAARTWLRSNRLTAAVVLGATSFVAATQVPPAAMNVGDDLQKYLAHIARMLQTGTLYGSPLNALGTESPGGQPFLQSFIAFAPFPYVNGFDALFCFALCIALAGSLTGGAPGLAVIAALAAASVGVIEPQFVNISALYSGSALVLALYVLLAAPEEIAASPPFRRALGAGIIAAALIALKPTLLMMAAAMLGAGALSIAVSTMSARAMFKWSGAAMAGLALGLAPWAALYAPYFGKISGAQDSIVAQSSVPPIGLFSSAPLTWGASGLAYTLAMTFPIVAGALALGRWRHLSGDEQQGAVTLAAAASATLLGYFFVVLVLGRYIRRFAM